METIGRSRQPSEALKRGYSQEEIESIFELARLMFENGQLRKAEVLAKGMTEVAPDFEHGWLALCYAHLCQQRTTEAIFAARQALRVAPEYSEAMLLLISALLITKDYNSAGTYLGEIAEKVESGVISEPSLVRFFKVQLTRYQNKR